MSKVGPPINGGADFSDPMGMRSRDFLSDDWTDKVNKMFSCDVDHMYASANEVQNCDREVQEMKDMMLVHLDLIQTMSETIAARDKELAAVKKENETLRLRFQRMERRVTLQRHKDDPPPPSAALGAAPPESPSLPVHTMPIALPPTTFQPEATPNSCKRRRASSSTNAKRGRRRTTSSSSIKCKRNRSTSDSNDPVKVIRGRPALTTEMPYHTIAGEPSWGAKDLQTCEAEAAKLEELVQVPSWRIKVLSPLYVIEGTENLDDDVFLKRHQKHELEERRRKRWDIQRLREQSQIERLKQRGDKKAKPAFNSPIHSLFPSFDDVEEISVGPTLPVNAFALPLRTFDSSEFNLPWISHSDHKSLPTVKHKSQ